MKYCFKISLLYLRSKYKQSSLTFFGTSILCAVWAHPMVKLVQSFTSVQGDGGIGYFQRNFPKGGVLVQKSKINPKKIVGYERYEFTQMEHLGSFDKLEKHFHELVHIWFGLSLHLKKTI